MISRRKFLWTLSGAVAAPIVIKASVLMPLRGRVLPPKELIKIESPWENYQKFVNTPYLDRMDFGNYLGYGEIDSGGKSWGPGNEIYDNFIRQMKGRHQNFVNEQVLAFRKQEPIKLLDRPKWWLRKPMKDCWREAVAEVNAKYGIRS